MKPLLPSEGNWPTQQLPSTEFPGDIFMTGGCLQNVRDEGLATLGQRLLLGRRLIIYGMRHARNAGARHDVPSAHAPDFFSVYLTDVTGDEQPFLDFIDSTSATYAALRIAQVYRLGVEFGRFAQPRVRATQND